MYAIFLTIEMIGDASCLRTWHRLLQFQCRMWQIIVVDLTPLLHSISSLRRRVSERLALALRKALGQRLAVCSERRLATRNSNACAASHVQASLNRSIVDRSFSASSLSGKSSICIVSLIF